MFKLQPVQGAVAAAKPQKKDPTFYAGLPHPLMPAIVALLESVAKGESADVAGDLKKAKDMIESPAVWVGIGTQVRDRATQEMVPFMRDGKPVLRGDSVILYTQDPHREVEQGELKGALIRTFGQNPGFIRSHPYFVALESAYQAEIGVGTKAPATQIPVGSAKAVPAGDEEVNAK